MFSQELEAERLRRKERAKKGDPYHHWVERGDKLPPLQEHWCEHCVGFFGVPHLAIHGNSPCRMAFSVPRQCACIDCFVAERLQESVVDL